MKEYNTTQLTPQKEFERHIYHRDQFAHYFRWSHVLKNAKIGQTVLDFGCGTAEMLELFYRNRYRPKLYTGLEIREKTVEQNKEKFKDLDFAEFYAVDLCQDLPIEKKPYDVITSFEVIEHIGHKNIDNFLSNMLEFADEKTVIYISTPNYDPRVGAAKNHLLGPDKEVGEWDHHELEKKLSEYFDIKAKYGTFASMKDYKDKLDEHQEIMFNRLSAYYDTNLLSNLFAPMFPEEARNCLWVLKKKGQIAWELLD